MIESAKTFSLVRSGERGALKMSLQTLVDKSQEQ